MNIKMLKTEKGSIDGITNRLYVEGTEYSLGGAPREMELARAFVKAGLAEEVVGKKLVVAASAPVDRPVVADVVSTGAEGAAQGDAAEINELAVAEVAEPAPDIAVPAAIGAAVKDKPKRQNTKAPK